jgi:hypothetical protein
MALEDLEDYEADPETVGEEAEDWDEETLGLDWNEAEAQNVVREVIPLRGFAD